MHFVSLFFLNERNITISLFMIHLKFTVAHFANLKSSFINKPYLRAVECAISFFYFDFLYVVILTRLLPKTLWKNYHFLIQISKIHFKMYYLGQNIGTLFTFYHHFSSPQVKRNQIVITRKLMYELSCELPNDLKWLNLTAST